MVGDEIQVSCLSAGYNHIPRIRGRDGSPSLDFHLDGLDGNQ